ncbi:MAG: hypothetical protein P8J27_03530, partial [Mariniblastus sp.]|nr:hypothetical protein [Mariniblastus sp.]
GDSKSLFTVAKSSHEDELIPPKGQRSRGRAGDVEKRTILRNGLFPSERISCLLTSVRLRNINQP